MTFPHQPQIQEKIESCKREGSPIANVEMAELALRYMKKLDSFDRSEVKEKLVRTWINKFEHDPRLVGPLKKDYEWLADQLH